MLPTAEGSENGKRFCQLSFTQISSTQQNRQLLSCRIALSSESHRTMHAKDPSPLGIAIAYWYLPL